MLKFIVISTLLATSALAQAVPKRADVTPLPLDSAVVTGTLPNGLRYFVRKNSRPAARAELRLVVNAGSLLEDDDQLGLAHFVEHMAFNGTVNFEKHELVDYIERIGMRFGADLNASTSFDETIYQLQVPTDSAHLLNTAMQILGPRGQLRHCRDPQRTRRRHRRVATRPGRLESDVPTAVSRPVSRLALPGPAADRHQGIARGIRAWCAQPLLPRLVPA